MGAPDLSGQGGIFSRAAHARVEASLENKKAEGVQLTCPLLLHPGGLALWDCSSRRRDGHRAQPRTSLGEARRLENLADRRTDTQGLRPEIPGPGDPPEGVQRAHTVAKSPPASRETPKGCTPVQGPTSQHPQASQHPGTRHFKYVTIKLVG